MKGEKELKKSFLLLGTLLLIVALGYYIYLKETIKSPVVKDEQNEFGYVTIEDLVIDGIKLRTYTDDYDDIASPNRIEQHGQLYYYLYYPDFTLLCYDEGDAGFIINSIIITSRSIKTKRGVCIGFSEMEVLKRYGDIGIDNGLITFTLSNNISRGICFKILNGEVAGIAVFNGNNPFDVE